MQRVTPRTANKFRRCESCLKSIDKGDKYLEHVASPNHEDLGNVNWWRSFECSDCASRYGRGDLLHVESD